MKTKIVFKKKYLLIFVITVSYFYLFEVILLFNKNLLFDKDNKKIIKL